MIRYLFKRDTFLATLLVFVLIGVLSLIPLNTHILDPIKLALQDFDYNDLAYSRMHKNEHTDVDTNVYIVNIGNAGRAEIAGMIAALQQRKPAVIGVDVFFERPKDPAADSLLTIIGKDPKVVMAYKLNVEDHHVKPEGFLYPHSYSKGFVNFVADTGGVNRRFAPIVKSGNERYSSFAAEVVKVADPLNYKKLPARDKKTETINYSRDNSDYIFIDGYDVLNGTDSTPFAGKIVLLGYVSGDPYNVEDKLFTPMNAQSFGKTLPDMHGVVIHANIINMIREHRYVDTMPAWVSWTLAFILCWIHMAIFLFYAIDRHLWFHLLAKIAQIVSAVLFMYLGLIVFYKFDFKLNLVPSFIAIILAVDVLYFYEAICNWLHKKHRLHSIFHNHKPH